MTGCPYCKVNRRTKIGLQEHIAQMHPGNISPSGILIAPMPAVTKIITEQTKA